MRYGIVLPGPEEIDGLVALAVEAEARGWDAVLYWDGVVPGGRGHDPWVVLAAIAARTERVRLGAMLYPLPWRRPLLIARALASLDQLSGGRAVLPVGLGAVHEPEIAAGRSIAGEPVDLRVRAELLDEGLEIVDGLAAGGPLTYSGRHYSLTDVRVPATLQRPRAPIWVVGAWGAPRSLRRAFRYDGWMAARATEGDLPAVRAYLDQHAPKDRPFDLIWEGETPGDDASKAAAAVRPYAEAGATWWIESPWTLPGGTEGLRRRIEQGPPRVD
jgi:alkanesulfonate monooxygenase SsuD/methylene tetrahydromethanopterin reductase-like flavin-dependent oxidoreductase (luciferase family)